MKPVFLALMCVLASSASVSADVLWIELTQGDLSDDRFLPTPLVLVPGDNFLFGTIDGDDGQGNIDRDYFSVVIPAGYQLSQLTLDGYISDDFAAFIGIQPGTVFPDDPETVRPEDLLGWTLFGPSDVNSDLLPVMGMNGQGFTPPLPAGTFTFWAQQLDYYTEWSANFVVEVPEPAALNGLLVLAQLRLFSRRVQSGGVPHSKQHRPA